MIPPDLNFEEKLWQQGVKHIVGIDEVGRGSWAGPLVSAGVILSKDFEIPKGFAESKQISPTKRAQFAKFITQKALAIKIVEVSHARIDKIGIGKATQASFRSVIRNIKITPDYFLVDAFYVNYFPKNKQLAIKKGDEKSASIAAASIIAKIYRDKLMSQLSKKFPNYGFEKHKGYGTKVHQQMIKAYGFAPIHRTSFNLSYLVS